MTALTVGLNQKAPLAHQAASGAFYALDEWLLHLGQHFPAVVQLGQLFFYLLELHRRVFELRGVVVDFGVGELLFVAS